MGGANINPLFQAEYVILAGLALVVVSSLLCWRTAARCRLRWRLALTVLRTIAVAGLAVLALNPGRWRSETIGVESEWALLVDRSRSMEVADANGAPRLKAAARIAQDAIREAGPSGRMRLVAFADRDELIAPESLATLSATGRATDLVGAGRNVVQRSRSSGRRLSGMLLLSDGRQTAPADPLQLAAECRAQNIPVFALPLGGDVPRKDLSVSVSRRQYVAFVGQKVRVAATVRNEGLGPVSSAVVLRAPDGTVAAEQQIELDSGASVPVAFTLTPKEAGYGEYEIAVPERPGESSVLNNRARVGLSVLKNKLRVFMAEGTPGWESKFLVQLLRQQGNMEVTTVYRLSAEHFFRVDTDLLKGAEFSTPVFPDTPEALAAYDMVLFGKGAEYFLTPERIALLKRFVSEQGACVVFTRGKPYGDSLPGLEPLEPAAWGPAANAPVHFMPAKSTAPNGLFGSMLPGAGDPVWAKLPKLQLGHRFTEEKPFAKVLAEGVIDVAGRQASMPLLVVRRVGKGLSVAVNAEGFWQWDFFPSVPEAPEVYRDFWPQLLLWAAVYSEFLPGQDYALRLSDNGVPEGGVVAVHVTARRGVEVTQPPTVRIGSGPNTVRTLATAQVAPGEPHWMAQVAMDRAGLYRVELVAAGGAGHGAATAMLEVKAPPTETDNLSADRDYLETLARESGGAVIKKEELAGVVARLEKPEETRATGRTIWEPLWNRGWVLGLILALFAGEGVIRRRNGLM